MEAFGDIKRVCPYCIKDFYPGDCRIVSNLTKDQVKPAPTTSMQKQIARKRPEPLIGPKYTRVDARRECPHCQTLLPYNIESVETRNIVVVGDTYAGKSHFLAALVKQIEDGQVGNPHQLIRFDCLNLQVKEKYKKDYLDKLFKNRQSLLATIQAVRGEVKAPLIYELSVRKSSAHPPRKANIVLYDASGEDYANPDRLLLHSPYVLNASAIIYLADPISMPNIFNSLPDHLQNQPATGRKASDALSVALQLLERDLGLAASSRLAKLPIAITLSKSDLLKILKRVSEQYRFLTRSKQSYDSGVDLKDLQLIDAEVRQLIYEYGDQTLLQAAQTLNVQFFAVSVTGHAMRPDGTYPAVEPLRCLDPVLWALNELRLIDAR